MVGADPIGVPAIGSLRNKGSWLYGFQPINSKVLAHSIGAYANILMTQLGNYSSNAITALMRVECGNDLLFHYGVFDLLLMGGFIVPFIKTAAADGHDFTNQQKRILIPDSIDKSIHRGYIPRLKIPKAFFKISRSCSVRRSAAAKRSFSWARLDCNDED